MEVAILVLFMLHKSWRKARQEHVTRNTARRTHNVRALQEQSWKLITVLLLSVLDERLSSLLWGVFWSAKRCVAAFMSAPAENYYEVLEVRRSWADNNRHASLSTLDCCLIKYTQTDRQVLRNGAPIEHSWDAQFENTLYVGSNRFRVPIYDKS